MNYQIVSDSSSNIFALPGVPYATVPMKVVVGEQEFVDDPQLDLSGMIHALQEHKGKSGSSCPNVQEWLDAFGDGDPVFGVTITKHLSGSFNAAQQAAQTYLEEHPERKVHIFDSLSAGPEMAMIIDKLHQLLEQGLDFETVRDRVLEYHNHTHTLFCLESMMNLARNGRVSPAVAKLAGLLGIRVVGEAQGGQITPVHKPRGEKKALRSMLDVMIQRGLADGGLVRIAHCRAEQTAHALMELVREHFPNCRFIVEPTTALCSYYAEVGGLIVGYEGALNELNDNRLF